VKILFVCSGNKGEAATLIQNQAQALISKGHTVDYFLIKGKGIKGYLKNIHNLKTFQKTNRFDIVHAHYSFSAVVATLSGSKPLVVSLMGSDIFANRFHFLLVQFFCLISSWRFLIVKSEGMALKVKYCSPEVIPNGVDLLKLIPDDKQGSQARLGWHGNCKHILFPANPERHEKNFNLTLQAIQQIKDPTISVHVFQGTPHSEVVHHYNASDVVVLTSLWEGSPNVIKEAMATNRPIVSTRVGDVEWLFGNEPGHFLADFTRDSVAKQIIAALRFAEEHETTNGRQRLTHLGLDSSSISERLISIYVRASNN